MSNTIWHGLADEWERCTFEEDLSYGEMLIFDRCAQELRALTDKWEADMKKTREVRAQEEQKYESEGRMALTRELAKRYNIIFPIQTSEINTI